MTLVIRSWRIYSEIFISRAIAKSQVRLAIVHCVHTHWIGYYWMCKKANVEPYGMVHTERRQPVLKVHRISNRQHIQRRTQISLSAGRAWRSSSAPQLCTYAYLCLYVTESRASPPRTVEALSLPSDAPQEATFLFFCFVFLEGCGKEEGGGVSLQLTLTTWSTSPWHTPYALPPPPPLLPVLRTAMAASNKRT